MYVDYKWDSSPTTNVSNQVTVTLSAVTSTGLTDTYSITFEGRRLVLTFPITIPFFSLSLDYTMPAERAERWDKIDLKPKRWWGYTIFLFILGTLLPPLGIYCSSHSSGLY